VTVGMILLLVCYGSTRDGCNRGDFRVAPEERRYSNRRMNDFRKLAQLAESAAIGWRMLRSFAAAAKRPE
jgi:hypothetical protein